MHAPPRHSTLQQSGGGVFKLAGLRNIVPVVIDLASRDCELGLQLMLHLPELI